jgi:hypothetical protein
MKDVERQEVQHTITLYINDCTPLLKRLKAYELALQR